jgi:hypothetical protein
MPARGSRDLCARAGCRTAVAVARAAVAVVGQGRNGRLKCSPPPPLCPPAARPIGTGDSSASQRRAPRGRGSRGRLALLSRRVAPQAPAPRAISSLRRAAFRLHRAISSLRRRAIFLLRRAIFRRHPAGPGSIRRRRWGTRAASPPRAADSPRPPVAFLRPQVAHAAAGGEREARPGRAMHAAMHACDCAAAAP